MLLLAKMKEEEKCLLGSVWLAICIPEGGRCEAVSEKRPPFFPLSRIGIGHIKTKREEGALSSRKKCISLSSRGLGGRDGVRFGCKTGAQKGVPLESGKELSTEKG